MTTASTLAASALRSMAPDKFKYIHERKYTCTYVHVHVYMEGSDVEMEVEEWEKCSVAIPIVAIPLLPKRTQ